MLPTTTIHPEGGSYTDDGKSGECWYRLFYIAVNFTLCPAVPDVLPHTPPYLLLCSPPIPINPPARFPVTRDR